jgi:4,5-dihydroxyphthalate decarboxylase
MAYPLTYAGLSYIDRTAPLVSGEVAIPGIDLKFVEYASAMELFNLQISGAPYKLSEMSLSSFMIMRDRGDDRFVGLPAFISRSFRHRDIYVHGDSAIQEPRDLIGKRIGLQEYQLTAALWIRGMLAHDYGVSPQDVVWVEGGLRGPVSSGRPSVGNPEGVRIERLAVGETLASSFASRKLDALISVQPPLVWSDDPSAVRGLFPDPGTAERDYFAAHRIFPIMHLVVLRSDVYAEVPWVARSVYDAFIAARQLGRSRLQDPSILAVGLPWLRSHLEETRAVFGEEPFPYGIDVNRPTLEYATQYAHEQKLISTKPDVSTLFVREPWARLFALGIASQVGRRYHKFSPISCLILRRPRC